MNSEDDREAVIGIASASTFPSRKVKSDGKLFDIKKRKKNLTYETCIMRLKRL